MDKWICAPCRPPVTTPCDLWCDVVLFGISLIVHAGAGTGLAGKKTETELYADAWTREDLLPSATIVRKPKSNTPYPLFEYVAVYDGSSHLSLVSVADAESMFRLVQPVMPSVDFSGCAAACPCNY
jgi:hypothetical protein